MAQAKSSRSKGRATADTDDPRFARLLTRLTADPHFAPIVEEYRARRAAGRREFGSRTLNVRGKMFAMMSKGRFVVKLPKERADALVTSGAGAYFDPGHGRLMKQWVELVDQNISWVRLAKEAHDFVAGLER